MKLVLFVGNGADLALNLRTGYKDFLITWLKNSSGEDLCEKFRCAIFDLKRNLLYGQINGDRLWSDLELALGALPYDEFRCIDGKSGLIANTVVSCVSLLQSELGIYLLEQQNKFSIPAKIQCDARRLFIHAVIYSALSGVVDVALPDTIQLNIITLNYTDSIDKILGARNDGETITVNGKAISLNISPVIYVHGKLGTDYMAFGIDNMSQLTGCRVDEVQFEQCKQLQKRSWVNNTELQRAESCIEEADLLMTYGISWGDTDLSWWRKILGFLTKGKLLCVCPHVADFGLILKYRLERKLEVLTRKRVVHAMLAGVCEDVCIHKIEDELSSNIRVPIIQDLKIDNRFVKAGDFLGLNSISELIKQNKT